MRRVFRAWALLTLFALLAPAGFAGRPARAKPKAKKAATANTAAAPAAKQVAAGGTSKKFAPAQRPRGARVEREAPKWPIIATTSGTLGLFTVETGETLPTKGFSFAAYINKFSRNPGSVSILNVGWNFGIGVRDWLTVFMGWEPRRHTHVGAPGQLSLNPPLNYVEDFPFALRNDGGVGDVTVGFKLGLFSEKRGNPVSLGVRNDFIIPTRRDLVDIIDNGTQTGQFNYAVTLSLSKTWGNAATLTGNWGYRFTRDPRFGGQRFLTQADQVRVGAGLLLFPESRVQFMTEYTGLIFVGNSTPTVTSGARDPIDGVWGVRLYLWKNMALDAGYRYMLNLRDVNDRHGFVVKLGTIYWPEKVIPNNSPTVALSADKSSVYAESGDIVTVRAQASDPDGDPLTYDWAATGGRVEGTGPEVRWNSAGTAVGTYTVTARVDDGRGGTASGAVDIRVEPRPNRAPTMSCSAERSSVLVGERVRITAVASDPDGDSLTYSWRTNGGQIIGSGASVQLDTTGAVPGRYTVTGRVDDGRGGAADCSTSVDVQTPPPPPQASKINECFFRTSSARVDNVCKRILDDVALRLKNEPRATVVIVGYADPKEPRAQKLAQQRGDNAAKYIASKGVEPRRINVRAAGGQAGAGKQNRRIDIVWVPEGATY